MSKPGVVKRFYEAATAQEAEGGFAIMLDKRELRTPAGALFRAPTRALADHCAAEWAAQGEQVAPATMPLTQLAFAAIDQTASRRDEIIAFLAKYAETDLCCHRAATPEGLAGRQAHAWDPLVAWGADRHGLYLPVVIGIMPASIDPTSVARVREIALAFDPFRLTALSQGASLAGSILIGLALLERHIDAGAAFNLSTIDESWSIEHWGEDSEMRARLDRTRRDFDALARFIAAVA